VQEEMCAYSHTSVRFGTKLCAFKFVTVDFAAKSSLPRYVREITLYCALPYSVRPIELPAGRHTVRGEEYYGERKIRCLSHR
jgi:hypothetical protein